MSIKKCGASEDATAFGAHPQADSAKIRAFCYFSKYICPFSC